MDGNMFRFSKEYFVVGLMVLITEICIALFVNDRFIRPYVGDFLVVILLYCLLKAFVDIPIEYACIGVLTFSFMIEFLQLFNILHLLELKHVKLLNIVLGHSFDWTDLFAYTAGIIVTYLVEKKRETPG